VLVSADDEAERDKVAGFLAALGVDFPTWLKRGDDMKFIDAIDKRWSGALPASFFFDASGRLARHCYGEVSSAELTTAWNHLMLHRKGRAHDPTHTPQADRHH
jgi:hypothetical protein